MNELPTVDTKLRSIKPCFYVELNMQGIAPPDVRAEKYQVCQALRELYGVDSTRLLDTTNQGTEPIIVYIKPNSNLAVMEHNVLKTLDKMGIRYVTD